MGLRYSIKLFNSHDGFVQFKNSVARPDPVVVDSAALRERALQLAQEIEPKSDRRELEEALAGLEVSVALDTFQEISAMLGFLAKTLFKDVSSPVPPSIKKTIFDYKGPIFFFVGHTSHYDYVLSTHLLARMGLPPPVMHATGRICTGWLSQWLQGLRVLQCPRISLRFNIGRIHGSVLRWPKEGRHRFSLPETSRYTVRAGTASSREPYVPHGVISSVKTTGRALVVPVAVSYAQIPEDRFLASSGVFTALSLLPRNWVVLLPYLFGLRKSDRLFRRIDGIFGDSSVDLGEPFELTNDDSLTLQRISHRAMRRSPVIS